MKSKSLASTFDAVIKSVSLILMFVLTVAVGSVCLAQDLSKLGDIKKIKDKKAFEYGGSLSVGGSYYHSSGPKRLAPYSWFVGGSPFIKLYGINIPFSFVYNETGRSLTHPFRYNFSGASPHYKWATTHLGYRSMNFSDYTVSGVVFNGIGVELQPKKFRIGAFYGVFNPAIEEDSTDGNFGVILPAYKRIGYGTKLGYGTAKNYFDLVYFRGKDDVKSLRSIPSFQTIKPADNSTISPRFKVTLFKIWFVEADIAVSVYTRNLLNDTLTETKQLRTLYKFIRVNTTTYGAFAGHVATGFNFSKWSVSFKAKRVSSDYQSMGINLIQDDIQEFTVNPSVQLWKGKLGISGSYGTYFDNLSQKRINTTTRKIYNTNITMNPIARLNASVGYSNFGTTRTNGIVQMNDSITFSIINESYNGNLSLIFGKIKKPVVVSLFTQYQITDDRNVFTQKYNNSEVFNAGLMAQHKFAKQKIQVSGGGSMAQFSAGGKQFNTQGGQLSFRKSFKDSKLNTNLGFNYTKRFQEGVLQGDVKSISVGIQSKISEHHSLSAQMRLMQNNTGVVSNTSLNEQRANLQYGFTF